MIKNIIKRVFVGVAVGFILFNLKACDVHAYVFVRTNNGNGGITNNTTNLTNVNGNWRNRYIFGFGNSDWIYDIGQYFNANLGAGGNELVVVADYYFGIETNGNNATLPTSYLNSDRNTLTANNLRCGIGNSYASGYDSTYTPTISNFSVTRAVGLYDWPQESYHVTFSYRQRLSSTFSGNSNVSCWFERQPSNGLLVQVNGSPATNLYFGYTANLQYSLSGDPNTSALQTITSQNSTIINQNQEQINNQNTMINQNSQMIDQNSQINSNIVNEGKKTQDKIDYQTDTIKDSTVPGNDQISNAIDSNKVQPPSNVSELVNLLPNTLNVIVNGFNNSCSGGYSLGSLYGHELIIPCINPVNYLGTYIWGIIDAILCLCFIIPFSKFLVNLYNDFTSLKNRRFM